jgi:DNA-binding NtrC family response regulator
MAPRVLLIEDDPIMGESLHDRFELEGFGVHWAHSIAEARVALLRPDWDAVVSDERLPDGSGGDLFVEQRRSAAAAPLPAWVFITAYASIDRAVAMVQAGAHDYVTKPFDIAELIDKLRLAVADRLPAASPDDDDQLGPSAPMRQLAMQARRIAARARTVLLSGESGAGKEVLARHLHRLAHGKAEAPFVAVNCGAIPESLIESALFGHERGAFTGADRVRRGYLEQAQGGTLFLDEIAELEPAMQVRLLRVLQEREVRRLGAETSIALDLRVICATHRDLRAWVREGRFREDLYYRINVVHLRVPPLRERPDDVLWLARRFVTAYASAAGERPRALSVGARAALLTHDWPGNVRELHNRIERACVFGGEGPIEARDLFEERAEAADAGEAHAAAPLPTLDAFVAAAERDYLAAVLARFGGRVGVAAQALGVSRKTLWEKSKRYGLRAAAD